MNVAEAPEITQENFRVLLPSKIAKVVRMLADKDGLTDKEALLRFYSSRFYQDFEREATKYWWNSPQQIFTIFQEMES